MRTPSYEQLNNDEDCATPLNETAPPLNETPTPLKEGSTTPLNEASTPLNETSSKGDRDSGGSDGSFVKMDFLRVEEDMSDSESLAR